MCLFSDDKRTRLIVYSLIALGIFVRIYFFFGHVYSDDAYYDYLAYTMYKGDYGADYIGYQCSIRTGQSILTAFSYFLFGTNEIATAVFPMIFSIFNMILSYRLVKIITKSEINAVIVLLFTAFYPTEILFASIAFTDLFSTVLIHSGILLLFIANRDNKISYSFFAGFLFSLSVLFKENVFYTAVLLSGLFVYLLIKKKTVNKFILLSLVILAGGIFLEAAAYYFSNGDFFYRLTSMRLGSEFSRHDFFNEGSPYGFNEGSYWTNLFKTIFIDNFTAVFLRRTMLFLPLLAVLQLIIYRKKRKNRIAVYWFIGLVLLYMFFTTSFTTYQPLVIRFTWYIFPLFLPAMILASKLFSEMKKVWMIVSLSGYILFSLYMTDHFREYFDMDNIDRFENFIKVQPERIIYTDHFTKYSIDLLDKFKEPSRVVRLNYSSENLIPAGALVVYHTGHISEIAKQGFNYPDEKYFRSNGFDQIKRFGSFIIFEKKQDQ